MKTFLSIKKICEIVFQSAGHLEYEYVKTLHPAFNIRKRVKAFANRWCAQKRKHNRS